MILYGKDKRVPKEEQCIFENHHPAIIDKATFSLVQELKEKRNLISYSPADEMNRRENTMIAIVMKLIAEDERGFTSAKYLSEHITDLGFKKTKQSILPYIELMKELGILEATDNPLKPYNIVKSKEEITQLTKDYLPDVSAETTAKQLADDYLHGISDDRRYARNGL